MFSASQMKLVKMVTCQIKKKKGQIMGAHSEEYVTLTAQLFDV